MATPKLRFKGFLEPWEPTKIGDFTSYYSGGTPSADNRSYYVGNIPFIRSAELNSSTTQLHINSNALANSPAKMVRTGMILYAIYGNGTSGKVGIARVDGAINQAIMAIDVNGGDYFNNYFLASWLGFNRSAIRRKYVNLGGQKNLSTSVVNDIRINVPNLAEQRKIGSLMAKINELIKLQSDKIEALKRVKNGYLQNMFVNLSQSKQRLRFKGFMGDWQQEKLSDLVSIRTGDKNVEDNNVNGRYVFFDRSSEIKHLDTYDYDGLVIVYAGEGNSFLPRIYKGKYSLHQRAYGLYNFDGVDPYYLYQYLLTQSNNFVRYAVGTTAKSLRSASFNNIIVQLPNIAEQKKISSFLETMDDAIKLQVNKLERLQELKKGYLQQLFA